MRRGLALLAAVPVALGAPPPALADEQIVAATPSRYVATGITMDQGERLTFRNTDVVMHDVTSVQEGPFMGHLFATPLIGLGESAFVEGSQHLTTGSYEFFCSAHPQAMRGTLTVTAAGTPVPRPPAGDPGPEPEPDTTPPSIELTGSAPRASSLRRARRLALTVASDEAARLQLTAAVGKRRAGAAEVELAAAGRRRIRLRLRAAVVRRLRRGTRVKVAARAVDAAGNAGTATLTLRLR